MEPVYRVLRREGGTPRVDSIEPARILSPAEREAARRRREEKRREVDERRSPQRPAQEPHGGADYSA